jgi:hypothetical protein
MGAKEYVTRGVTLSGERIDLFSFYNGGVVRTGWRIFDALDSCL